MHGETIIARIVDEHFVIWYRCGFCQFVALNVHWKPDFELIQHPQTMAAGLHVVGSPSRILSTSNNAAARQISASLSMRLQQAPYHK